MNTYWDQWSRGEVLSFHGIEVDDMYQDGMDRDEGKKDTYEKHKEHICSGCMSCLGLSWRDFL